MSTQIKKNLFIFALILTLIFSSMTLFTLAVVDYNVTVQAFAEQSGITGASYNYENSAVSVCASDYKLFGIIPIGQSESKEKSQKYVTLGGYPLGIDIKTQGLYITSKVNVVTKEGAVCPVEECDIKAGDVLYAIDGVNIDDVSDINSLIDAKETVEISVKRSDGIKNYTISPATDVLSGQKKLGLLLQDGIEGIGTMTYTDGINFFALGHTIKDMNGDNVKAQSGNIFNADIVGYEKGQKGKAGELNGSFSTMSEPIGSITANNEYGLYGKLVKQAGGEKILIGNKSDVKPGSAYIYTTIDKNAPQKYEIQIIKVNRQNAPDEKSMVLRITDKRLLDTTGGIVQGMSGSPIVQDGKLIGAVTHVFVSDPTKGYGVFIEWMQP